MKVRKSKNKDLDNVQKLLKNLDLPGDGVENHFDHFFVLYDDEKLVGVGGMEIYGKIALLRSLGIAEEYQNKGHGTRIFKQLIKYAVENEMEELYLFTETAEKLSLRMGFKRIDIEMADEALKQSKEYKICSSAIIMYMKTNHQKHLQNNWD